MAFANDKHNIHFHASVQVVIIEQEALLTFRSCSIPTT